MREILPSKEGHREILVLEAKSDGIVEGMRKNWSAADVFAEDVQRKTIARKRALMHTVKEDSFADDTELIRRFARSYRRQFSDLIEQLNKAPYGTIDSRCVRLCVEAMDMVLLTQDRMAQVLRRLDDPRAIRHAA